jgi:hypothetical protein
MSEQSQMPDNFDRLIGSLHGIPEVVKTAQSTVQNVTPLTGRAQTYIVQTYRHKELGDTIFLQCVSGDGSYRIALPSKVADVIARQREALGSKSRSQRAKRVAEDRKSRGVQPFGGLTPEELRRRRKRKAKAKKAAK